MSGLLGESPTPSLFKNLELGSSQEPLILLLHGVTIDSLASMW